ncbi:MAG: hypothetical protein ACI9F9_000007 [Candidatus Paceibacteria bacterium]|jgi:hypothetical protein
MSTLLLKALRAPLFSIPLATLIAAVPAIASPFFDSQCVKDGETTPITFDADMPVGGEVKDNSTRGFESDTVSDDPLGAGDAQMNEDGSATVSVDITNEAGRLSGPNGTVQTGFGEGDCIEVYVTFTVRYKVQMCTRASLGAKPWGVGGSIVTETCWEQWISRKMKSKTKTVCPCP